MINFFIRIKVSFKYFINLFFIVDKKKYCGLWDIIDMLHLRLCYGFVIYLVSCRFGKWSKT